MRQQHLDNYHPRCGLPFQLFESLHRSYKDKIFRSIRILFLNGAVDPRKSSLFIIYDTQLQYSLEL